MREPPINPNYPSAARLPKWTPFHRMMYEDPAAQLWVNSRYQVTWRLRAITVGGREVAVVLLGISNFDQSARHDWREFQRIKNELVGPEWEAVEIHPPESRLVDPSNFYLLWCFEQSLFEVGMNERRVLVPASSIAPQRAFEEAAQ